MINMKHELVRLAQAIGWPVLEVRFGAVHSAGGDRRDLPLQDLLLVQNDDGQMAVEGHQAGSCDPCQTPFFEKALRCPIRDPQ